MYILLFNFIAFIYLTCVRYSHTHTLISRMKQLILQTCILLFLELLDTHLYDIYNLFCGLVLNHMVYLQIFTYSK